MADEQATGAGDDPRGGGLRGARARLGRRAARRRRPRAASTRCATRRRTSWRRPSWRPLPRRAGSASARRSRTASTTTSTCRARSRPTTWRRSRSGCARASRPTTRSSARERRPSTTAARFVEARGPGVQGRDPRRPRCARRAGRATPLPVTTFYEHGPFIDLCQGPHVATHRAGSARSGCSSVAGAYWRGDEKRPMLQRIYGTVWETQEELDQFLWRREEAKKRDHRRLGVAARPVQLPRRQPGLRLLAPEGLAALPDARDAMRELQDRRGYQEIYTPPLVHQKLWEQSGPLGPLPRRHVPGRGRGPDVQPQADELPREHVHLPQPSCARTATCRSGSSEYGGLHRNERSGVLSGPDPRPPLRARRRPHLRPARPDRGRDRGAAGRGRARPTRWFGLDADAHVRHAAGQGARRPGRSGSGPRRSCASALERSGRRVPRQARGRRVLRAQDRHPDRGRAGPRVADGDDPGGPRDAARALRPLVHRRGRPASSARSRSTAPSTAPWSGSSAS